MPIWLPRTNVGYDTSPGEVLGDSIFIEQKNQCKSGGDLINCVVFQPFAVPNKF
jgi:hypothetical protein